MSYPPKHPSNGPRNFTQDTAPPIGDAWYGDTVTYLDGSVYTWTPGEFPACPDVWRMTVAPAKTQAA